MKIAVSGRPGSGKTTLIIRIAELLGNKACGFYTREIRERARVGFEIVTLSGKHAILAHVSFKGPKVGKYGVNVDVMKMAVDELREGLRMGKILIIDEIGPMELKSREFKEFVEKVVRSDVSVIASVHRSLVKWAQAQGFEVFWLERGNWSEVFEKVRQKLSTVLETF